MGGDWAGSEELSLSKNGVWLRTVDGRSQAIHALAKATVAEVR